MTGPCEQADRLNAYYDGELPEEEARDLEAHIRVCPDCACELDRLRRLSRLVAAAHSVELASEAVERLHASVGAVRERIVVRFASFLTAAAAAVLLLCSVWLLQPAGTSDVYSASTVPWERAAMGASVEMASADAQTQLAQWIVEDLSQENGDD